MSRGRRFGPVLSFDHSEFCIVNMQSVRGRASGLACAGAHCDQLDVAAGEPTIIVREGEGVCCESSLIGPLAWVEILCLAYGEVRASVSTCPCRITCPWVCECEDS